jgi:protein phosphatase
MNAGDVASMLAISTGVKLADKSVKWGLKINEKEARDLLRRLSAHFCEIDNRITRKSRSDRRLFGMGTTLTLVYSVGFHLFLVHVGDSRAYLYRKSQLQQLTKDHTAAQALADAGTIPQVEVRKHSRRNVLTNYLGGHSGKVNADIRWLRLEDEDRILVCTDGLTDMVDDHAIASCLEKNTDPVVAVRALTHAALDQGGTDNITVVVANYSIPHSASLINSKQSTAEIPAPPVDTPPTEQEPGETVRSPG